VKDSSAVEIRLFGQASVTVSGAPLKVQKRATTFALLAYLILRHGAHVARSSVAFALFPDESEEHALAELRRYLYLTGKTLPSRDDEPWIIIDGETVSWNQRAPCRIDVIEFEQCVANESTLARAVDLYTGDLLEEIYDDWVVSERERLRALCLDALAKLVRSHREQREYGRALSYAERLLSLDPWREDIVRTVMSLHYDAGDAAGAMAEFTRFAQRLRDELSVAPMPETLAVRDAILRSEPLPGAVVRPPQHDASGGVRATPMLPFIGRAREIASLQMHWTRAARGNGSFVLIAGEAGVGKTRLAAELARTAESQGGRVFVGATSTPESMPYQSIVEALRSALPLLSARPFPPPTAAVLARVLPELQAQFGRLPEIAPVTSEDETKRVLNALADAVLRLSRPRPALLVLEDLHWAGSATLEALATLARRVDGAPLLVLATYRDEEAGPSHRLRAVVRELKAEQRLATVALERLEREDVADLITKVKGLAHDDTTIVDRLYAHTEGNALFLNETIAEAIEHTGGMLPALSNASNGIAAVIASRTDRLGDAARTVAEAAAVCGQGSSLEVLGDVVTMSAAAVSEAVNELLDRRILREASARSGVDYVFSHQLIGASIYQRIAPSVRARRHARIAHVMQRLHAERPNAVARELAVHFERAGLADEAARWFGEGARASAAVYAAEDAIALASKALELERDRAKRIELLQLREELQGRAGDRSGQRADIEALDAELADSDDAARFDVLRRRMLLARSLGETQEERALIKRMTSLANSTPDLHVRAEALRHRAAHAVLLSRQVEAREPAAEALTLFEKLGDVPAQVECLGLLVDASTNAGDLEAARGYLDAMRRRASSQADRVVHARALTIAATAALLRQQYRESQELTREVLTIAELLGDRDAEAFARARIAATAAWLGDFDLALTEFDRSLALFGALGNKRGLATTLTNKVLLAMRLGLFDEAERLIDQSNALLDIVQEQRMAVANAVNLSFVRLHRGDADGAKRSAAEALITARTIGFPVFEAAALANLGNAERALGNLDAAIAHMQSGLAIRRGLQAPSDFADDLSDLTFAFAEAGRTSEALACAEELAEISKDSPSGPLWPHYIAWAASEGFRVSGRRDQARAFAKRAHEELTRFAESIRDPALRNAFQAIDVSQKIAAVGQHENGRRVRVRSARKLR